MTDASGEGRTEHDFEQPWPARDRTEITGVRAIATAPGGVGLLVVRIDTNVPGLYGLGCATFTQRWQSVAAYVETYLAPMLIGRYPGDITDLVQLSHYAGYWREGPTANNAISGVDQALWDIAGKRAGMPIHELLGGKVRDAVSVYLHASGNGIDDTLTRAEALIERGLRHVRLQMSMPGRGHYGGPPLPTRHPQAPYPDGWDARTYLREVPALFEAARERLPAETELLHDVHSRLSPSEAIQLAHRLEPYQLFFLEDVVAPELWDELPRIKAQVRVPLAVGELATSFGDAARLVRSDGVDFIRCHISMIGGLTPARRLAALAGVHGVRTAWHGPPDTSPIGAAANVALGVTEPAFGIQEGHVFADRVHDVFPGTLRIDNGWLRPNNTPGWGIDLDERVAARFPAPTSRHDAWAARVRSLEGALLAP